MRDALIERSDPWFRHNNTDFDELRNYRGLAAWRAPVWSYLETPLNEPGVSRSVDERRVL